MVKFAFAAGPLMTIIPSRPPEPPRPTMSADARKRQNLVVTLRHAGKNYREIGDVLGVSVTRARQVYLKAMKDRMTDEKLLLALMTAIDERFDGMGMEETRAGVRLQIMAALDQAKKYLESL